MTAQNTLECPHCGNSDLDEIQHVERAWNYRNLLVLDTGLVYIDEFIQDTDSGSGADLICLECSEHFPCPKTINIGTP